VSSVADPGTAAPDCECDVCNEAAHNVRCTGCDCCASGDCAAFFCAGCPCTAGEQRG
jgi:hypothetical protein